ncbi:MAG: RNA polymerase sigma factor [Pirellulaceae bacterium]|nr:RNA polymerase sigma factor [Planctomycetales bacterium]
MSISSTTTTGQDLHTQVSGSLAGDQGAMRGLVDRFRDRVFSLCYRMLGHRQDAEDAAQETFVRMLRHLHRWDSTRDFEPWLLSIAGNRCRTMLGRRMRRSDHQLHNPDNAVAANPDHHAARQLSEEVRLALDDVAPRCREAFLLFHDEQLSYMEIAERLDCPIGTAKTWVHRARRDLMRRLIDRGVIEENSHAMR